jgi:hypothetical protein
MKKPILIVAATSTLLLTGCLVTSVYPFYTDKDIVSESGLAGKWASTNEETEHWVFEKDATRAFRLTYTTKTSTNIMSATPFRLGDNKFLDLMGDPETGSETQPPPIPSHFLLHLLRTSPSITMVPMDYDWLTQLLTNKPAAVRHHFIGEGDKRRLVLTADTKELQAFVIKHINNKEAWGDALELKRE